MSIDARTVALGARLGWRIETLPDGTILSRPMTKDEKRQARKAN